MTATVLSIRPMTGRGNLHALADVELRFEGGLNLTLHKVRIIQQPAQKAYVALPQVETADGKFFAAVSGSDLREAIQPLVLDAWQKHQSAP